MPDYVNQALLARRLQGLRSPNPFADYLDPGAVAPDDAVASIAMPTPRLIAPSRTEGDIRQLIQDMPMQSQDRYAHPGKLNRIAAIASGISAGIQEGGAKGVEAAQAVRLAPYNRAMGEWESKLKALDPLAELEMRRGALSQTQYGHEISGFGAQLRGMNAQQLNDIRTKQLAITDSHNKALETYQKDTEPRALRIEAERAANRLIQIDRTIAGQKAVADINVAGRKADRTSREDIAAAGRTAAMERTKANISARPKRPMTAEQERFAAEQLIRSDPRLAVFMNPPEGNTPATIKSVKEIEPEQMELWKLFNSKLAEATNRSGITYEDVDEDVDEDNEDEQ